MATEKRLIPLQKRIVYAGDVFNSLMAEKGWSATEASDFMKVFRMVDAVEVVRCKDCKNNGACSIQDAMNWTPRTEIGDYYCSYGERRTDG